MNWKPSRRSSGRCVVSDLTTDAAEWASTHELGALLRRCVYCRETRPVWAKRGNQFCCYGCRERALAGHSEGASDRRE